MDVRCSFAVRVAVDGGYRYDRVSLGGYHGDGSLHTEHPPVAGDVIHLWSANEGDPRGTFVVVARQWSHPSWGSFNWPHIETRPKVGPMLDVIVEPAEGVYRNEVLLPDEE